MANQNQRTEQSIVDPSLEIGPVQGLCRSPQGIQTAEDIYSDWGYHFDRRNQDPDPEDYNDKDRYKSMYHKALKLEQLRVIQSSNNFMSEHPKDFLDLLADEIKCRVKITQSEIFKIGEILVLAKKICQQNNLGFKDWIKDTFDFSYETANNFMNVYTHCFGFRHIALKMKPSLLYKVSSPSFPDELREWVFEKGNLSRITNGELTGLQQKFKKGGWEAVQEDVQELSQLGTSHNELEGYFDQVEDVIRRIRIVSRKMLLQGFYDLDQEIIKELQEELDKAGDNLRNKKIQLVGRLHAESLKTIDKVNDVTALEAAS